LRFTASSASIGCYSSRAELHQQILFELGDSDAPKSRSTSQQCVFPMKPRLHNTMVPWN